MATPTPTLQALVLCDQLYQDQGSGKFVIAGTFTRIHAMKFPTVHPLCWLYARILGAAARAEARFRCVDLSTNAALGESGPIPLVIADPVVGLELGIRIPPLGFQRPGAYSIEFLWGRDRVVLGDWRFEVALLKAS